MSTRSLLWGALAAAFAAGAVLATPATAQTRYTRDVKVRVDAKQTEKTRVRDKPKKEEKARPEISADDVIAIEGKVAHIRDEVIRNFMLLIEDTPPNDPQLPDLYFRLAELYAQKQRYWRFRGMELQMKIDRTKNAGQKRKLQGQQKRYLDESQKALLDAVKSYRSITRNANFRNYPRMDEVLFYKAYTLQGANYMKEARSAYHRLIKDYPNSQYIPNAYLSFADYYFDQNSLANAEQFYDKVLEFPKSNVFVYALYKKGWVYLNLDRPQDALETFFRVAQLTARDKKQSVINRAAKRDFVRAYAEVGKPQLAHRAFERVDKSYAFEMLQILADIYMGQGKNDKAIFTFREMIGLQPRHQLVCEWQYNVVYAMLASGNQRQRVEEIERLVNLYVAYRDRKILPPQNLAECGENAEAVNSEMARVWHNEAIKTLNPQYLGDVEHLYALFVKSFPESAEFGEMQYYHAELLWQRAESEKNARLATELWERAAVAFTDVVKSGKVEGDLLRESAHAAVLSWQNALNVDPRKGSEAPPPDTEYDKVPPPTPIPEREQRMISAFDVYIEYIKDPKDDQLVVMKFFRARIYWRYNHLDQAVPLFEDIINNHLEHETAEFAVNLLIDTLNRQQRFDEMIKWVDILLEKKKFLADKEDLQENLERLKNQSLRRNAEQLEKVAKDTGNFGAYIECGMAFLDIYNRNPEADKSDEVLYNAGVCFEQGRSIGVAIQMFETLSRRFPKSRQTQMAIGRLGLNYGRIAWYDKAADRLEEYARRFGGEDDAYKALSDAVFYRKGIGHDDAAIKNTEFFIKQYGKQRDKREEVALAMFGLTAIYEKQGDADAIIRHLRRYLREYGNSAVDREIIARVKIGMLLWEQSCPVKGVDGACVRITRERSIVQRRSGKQKRAQLPTQCGPESKINLTVVARDARRVREAQQEFRQAIRLFSNGAAVGRVGGETDHEKAVRASHMIRYYAAARFFLNEQDYEAFLGITFPQGLDFDPKNKRKAEQSMKQFMSWFNRKQELGAKASGEYRSIVDITGGGAHYAIAGAARIGQISQNFSDALFTAEIPRDVRTGAYAEDKVDAYCDELTTRAGPLEELSIGAFGFCLETSTKLNWFNEWSRLCERELGQIRPQDFPTASEVYANPYNVAAIIDNEGPILDLTTGNRP